MAVHAVPARIAALISALSATAGAGPEDLIEAPWRGRKRATTHGSPPHSRILGKIRRGATRSTATSWRRWPMAP